MTASRPELTCFDALVCCIQGVQNAAVAHLRIGDAADGAGAARLLVRHELQQRAPSAAQVRTSMERGGGEALSDPGSRVRVGEPHSALARV